MKKKKYNLPTVSNFNNNTNDNDGVSNNVTSTDDITIIAETQTQIVEATQNPDVACGAPKAQTEDVVDLGKITTAELQKTPVTDVTHGEKARTKHQAISRHHFHSRRKDW